MQTTRVTNPNNPQYKALDGDGILPPVNVSLLPIELFEKGLMTPGFRVTRNTGPESNLPYVYPDGTTSLNHPIPNLKYDDIAFGNSIPAFDHHFSIPEDVNKISTFNVYDKRYHRNAMGEAKIASADAGVSDLLAATGGTTRSAMNRSINTPAPGGATTTTTTENNPVAGLGLEPTPPSNGKSKLSQTERDAIRNKVLTTKVNTTAPEISGTPANYDFNNEKTLDLIAKRVLNESAINAPPVTKNFVRPKNHIADANFASTKTSAAFNNMSYKQKRAQAELQAEIAEVRKLVVPDVEAPPPPPVVEAPGKGAKKPAAAAPAKKK